MKLLRYSLALILLLVSGQSLALFMPDGFKINTEKPVVVADGDC